MGFIKGIQQRPMFRAGGADATRTIGWADGRTGAEGVQTRQFGGRVDWRTEAEKVQMRWMGANGAQFRIIGGQADERTRADGRAREWDREV